VENAFFLAMECRQALRIYLGCFSRRKKEHTIGGGTVADPNFCKKNKGILKVFSAD